VLTLESDVRLDGDARVADAAEPSLRGEWRALLLLAVWFVAAAVAVGAHRNVPVIDDWTYAWSVERMLRDGRFEVLDWSAVFPVGHVIWGTLWSLTFGFSFVTLRLSTLALAFVASGALYFILRELEAPPRIALLGALSVAANPVLLLLSSSFMTDVPFVAFTLLALLCYVRAMRRGRASLVWWGGAWAFAAFLDRQIGVLTPLAALPLLVHRSQLVALKRSSVVLALAGTWGAMLVSSLLLITLLRPTGEMSKLVERLSYVLQIPAATYLGYNLYVLSAIAFYALPALLAMASFRGLWRRGTLFALLLGLGGIMMALIGEIPVPLRPGGTWTLSEIGGSRVLIHGMLRPSTPAVIEIALRALGFIASALALMTLMGRGRPLPQRLRHGSGPLVGRMLDAARAIPITTRTPLVAYLFGYLLIVNVLWMYNDRYLLVLLPVLVALALGRRQQQARLPRLAWVATGIFAIVAVAGTRDALRFNQSVRDSWQALVEAGVRPSDIDAGYTWTGWTLYAHPENLASGLTVADVPWITSKRRLPYVLSKGPLDGYDVTHEVSWSDVAPWPGPDRLLVLKQRVAN